MQVRMPSGVRRRSSAALAALRRFSLGRTLSQALRVRAPWRYLAAGLLRTSAPRRYELRSSGLSVLLRHGTWDEVIFDEIFCSATYAPPAEVRAGLDALGRAPRILDLGANVGYFTIYALGRWPAAQVVSFEPDPGNAGMLNACVRVNAKTGQVEVVQAAAAAHDGTLQFVAGLAAESHRVHPAEENVETVSVPAVDVLPYLADADLVKMDIEGGEWEILADPRLASRRGQALVLEHHGRHLQGEDPRRSATDLLRAAGYEVRAEGPAPQGVGLLWAWRLPAEARESEPATRPSGAARASG